MDDPLIRAKCYRERAASLREMAGLDDNPKTQKELLAIAEQYDALYEKLRHLAGNPNKTS